MFILIGSDEFSEEDEDWACSEVFSSEEDMFHMELSENTNWETVLEIAAKLSREYLSKGKHKDKLLNAKAVAIGFVDGDLKLLHL